MNSQPIRFFHRGHVVEIDDVQPTRTVLDWLREDARYTGTKEGCNEGDCGACTIVIGELAPSDGASQGFQSTAPMTQTVRGLTLRAMNSCIQFLPTLDGKALFTVEDLKTMSNGALHPAQQALVDCHGSQCGFCTPGFVMSLYSTYEHHQVCGTQPTRQQLADELAGNLCRCTGYRPILDAGQRMFDLPPVALDTAPVVAALESLKRSATFEYSAPAAHGKAASSKPPAGFYAPTTLDELAELRAAKPSARILAGSTDVGLWVNKLMRDLGDIIYVGNVSQMKQIETRADELYIGAGTSIEDAYRAVQQRFPELLDIWLRFSSPPIRNAGTIGGNIANGSPIGDSPPVFMALDAQIELRKGSAVRRMRLDEFYIDYMKNHMQPGEFVQALAVPNTASQRIVRGYKISKRFDSDISAVCAGLAIELDGDVVKSVRIALGGMAATVKRAAAAEAAMLGNTWDKAALDAAKAALAAEFKPLTDMRASAAYRMQVAQNLLERFWLETRTRDPLSQQDTSVWAIMPHVTERA